MSGRIPVYRDEQFVGEILWSGGIASGTWAFRVSKKLDELDQQRVRREIRRAREMKQDLTDIQYRGPIQRSYKGWTGFVGTLGAFEYALPAFGLQIDRSDVTWPPYKKSDLPDGIDTDSEQAQFERNEEIRIAEAEQELVAFRERQS
jgi:hypothetical protein